MAADVIVIVSPHYQAQYQTLSGCYYLQVVQCMIKESLQLSFVVQGGQ